MKYIGKKIVILLFTLFIVSFLAFLVFSVIPGDPATAILGTSATPEKIAALQEKMGLNEPFFVQYGTWLAHFVTGDMGTSYSYQIPVAELFLDKLPITLCLTTIAFIFMMLFAFPIGVYAAKHAGGIVDQIISILNQFVMAIPPFFVGIILTYLFGLVLHFFVPGGFVSYQVNFGAFLGYLILPAIAIALPKSAMVAKLLKGSILEQADLDYVRTAYSRGNSTNSVLWKHILPNAMIPVITFMGMALADMLTGSIIIEQVFGIPGLGRILLTSISNRDYPVVQAIIVCIAFIINIINFIVDILYQKIDPRIHVN